MPRRFGNRSFILSGTLGVHFLVAGDLKNTADDTAKATFGDATPPAFDFFGEGTYSIGGLGVTLPMGTLSQ